MNILMILQSDYPPDIRLTKEIKALTNAGYKLFLLCNNNKNRDLIEKIHSATIIRLPKFAFFPLQIAKLIRLPLFFSPLWFWLTCDTIIKFKIKAIHVHDLPLAPLAVIVANLFHLPLIYDMHENYPAAMEEWKRKGNYFQGLVKNPKVARYLNNFTLRKAAKIIVVVDEQKHNLINQNIHPDKIHVVENTVDTDSFKIRKFNKNILEQYKSKFIILYIGSFSTERGLGTSILAMSKIKKDISNALLLLVGDGKNSLELKKIVSYHNLDEFVKFTGWVDFEYVPTFMKMAHICIIPQPSNPANDTTCPHKLFQYMYMGKPVLCSDARPLKRIVTECQCGEIFLSENTQDFVNQVLKISQNIQTYGENGKTMVSKKYNWSKTSNSLVEIYSQIFNKKKG